MDWLLCLRGYHPGNRPHACPACLHASLRSIKTKLSEIHLLLSASARVLLRVCPEDYIKHFSSSTFCNWCVMRKVFPWIFLKITSGRHILYIQKTSDGNGTFCVSNKKVFLKKKLSLSFSLSFLPSKRLLSSFRPVFSATQVSNTPSTKDKTDIEELARNCWLCYFGSFLRIVPFALSGRVLLPFHKKEVFFFLRKIGVLYSVTLPHLSRCPSARAPKNQ